MLQNSFNNTPNKFFKPEGFDFINIFGLSVVLAFLGMLLLHRFDEFSCTAGSQLVEFSMAGDVRHVSFQNLPAEFMIPSVSVQQFDGVHLKRMVMEVIGILAFLTVAVQGMKLLFGHSGESLRREENLTI